MVVIMKRIVAIITVLFLAFSFSSCRYGILPENAAYYTETINSLLWCRGNSSDGDQKYNPQIEIIDRDSFGRVLFSYKEGFSGADHEDLSNLNIYAFLIMQAEDDEFVYYYEDVNYVCVNFADYREDVNADKCIKMNKSTKQISSNFDSSVNSFIESKKKEAGTYLRVCPSGHDNFGRTIISMSEFGWTP